MYELFSLPGGENRLAGLHEFTVTETRTPLTFGELDVGQVFWEPQTRKSYKKIGVDRIEALKPEHEYERSMIVGDLSFVVEL
jgi:hypothetical protein